MLLWPVIFLCKLCHCLVIGSDFMQKCKLSGDMNTYSNFGEK
uniref:Uncharacterized protein n=1 Tax=Rhizophora mucronata TaxID=61149 RepID=A0A2P2QJU2_RHIMU